MGSGRGTLGVDSNWATDSVSDMEGGMVSVAQASAAEDLRRAFKEGLVVGVLPVFDGFVVTWVVCSEGIWGSIRADSVLLREKEICILY